MQTKELFKKGRYLNLHKFNNRNAITKIRLTSHNFAINTTKWSQDEIQIVFSCKMYDKIQRKAFNDINEVYNIKLQVENKVEKLKLFFAKVFLKALNIFGQFLIRAIESR